MMQKEGRKEKEGPSPSENVLMRLPPPTTLFPHAQGKSSPLHSVSLASRSSSWYDGAVLQAGVPQIRPLLFFPIFFRGIHVGKGETWHGPSSSSSFIQQNSSPFRRRQNIDEDTIGQGEEVKQHCKGRLLQKSSFPEKNTRKKGPKKDRFHFPLNCLYMVSESRLGKIAVKIILREVQKLWVLFWFGARGEEVNVSEQVSLL